MRTRRTKRRTQPQPRETKAARRARIAKAARAHAARMAQDRRALMRTPAEREQATRVAQLREADRIPLASDGTALRGTIVAARPRVVGDDRDVVLEVALRSHSGAMP